VRDFRPAQGAQVVYNNNNTIGTAWARNNLLTIIGRTPSLIQQDEQAAAAGAIIAVYLDVVVHATGGTYQDMFFNHTSACPGSNNAIPIWTDPPGNDFGNGAADIRVPHFADKLVCVVKNIKADLPHVKAIFLDDFGPGWTGYERDPNGDYDNPNSQRCIARSYLGPAFDRLREENLNLLFFANASWHQQSCGGWPVQTLNGLRGANGVLERRPTSEIAFWETLYGATTSQWLKDSKGNGGTLVITGTTPEAMAAETAFYQAKPWVGWIVEQAGEWPYENGKATPPLPNNTHSIGLSYGDRYGASAAGAEWSAGQAADRLRARRVTLPQGRTLQSATIMLDGLGGTAGTQKTRMAIYRNSNNQPGTLVAVGKELTIYSSSAAAWYTSEFTPITLTAGDYWITEFTGPTAGVSRNNGTPGTNYYAGAAPYASGAPATFPAGGTGSVDMSVYMSVK
jgi:hypothetical protein